MKREIKFRAWNAQKKEMLIGQSVMNFTVAHLNLPSFNWMQFTGLKDKNGKEIYEGDVIREEFLNPSNVYQVTYFTSCFRAEGGGYRFYLDAIRNPTEIIGNIYENPDLIK